MLAGIANLADRTDLTGCPRPSPSTILWSRESQVCVSMNAPSSLFMVFLACCLISIAFSPSIYPFFHKDIKVVKEVSHPHDVRANSLPCECDLPLLHLNARQYPLAFTHTHVLPTADSKESPCFSPNSPIGGNWRDE